MLVWPGAADLSSSWCAGGGIQNENYASLTLALPAARFLHWRWACTSLQLARQRLRRLVARLHLLRRRVSARLTEEPVQQRGCDRSARRLPACPDLALRAALLEEHLDALDDGAARCEGLGDKCRVARDVGGLEARGAQSREQP